MSALRVQRHPWSSKVHDVWFTVPRIQFAHMQIEVTCRLGYPQRFLLNFSLYITFLGHIINSLSPTFSFPTVVPPKYFPYTPLQYKISFSISTFHLLSIFLLLLIEGGPTGTVEGGARAAAGERERGVLRRGVRGRGLRCGL
jgi:hypothetical protein